MITCDNLTRQLCIDSSPKPSQSWNFCQLVTRPQTWCTSGRPAGGLILLLIWNCHKWVFLSVFLLFVCRVRGVNIRLVCLSRSAYPKNDYRHNSKLDVQCVFSVFHKIQCNIKIWSSNHCKHWSSMCILSQCTSPMCILSLTWSVISSPTLSPKYKYKNANTKTEEIQILQCVYF